MPRPAASSAAHDAEGPALAALRRFVAAHPDLQSIPTIGVAFSGGADSTALLLAAAAHWGQARVVALHVDHGLQAAAEQFTRETEMFCRARGIAWAHRAVALAPQAGDSVEEIARDARYRALANLAADTGCGVVLLGQHGDDQVESLLLALLRGAGPRGLAAMPERMKRFACQFARPLLACGAQELRDSLTAADVPFVDDPMNHEPAFRRTRIRAELLPVIARLEPGYRATLARSARLCAEADAVLAEQAAADYTVCREPGGLRLVALRELGEQRAAEVIRHWLRAEGLRLGSARTKELVRQVLRTADGAQRLEVRWPQARLARRGGLLVLEVDVPTILRPGADPDVDSA